MKNHLLKITLVIIVIFSFILIFQNSVQATQLKLQIPLPGNMNQVILINPDSLGDYISNLYRFAVGALAIISVVMIMIGGFQWLMSAGRSEHVTSAKDKIYNSIIGLILALTSYLLLNTINPNLVKFQSLNIIPIVAVPPYAYYEEQAKGICGTMVSNAGVTSTNIVVFETEKNKNLTCDMKCKPPLIIGAPPLPENKSIFSEIFSSSISTQLQGFWMCCACENPIYGS